MLPLEAVPMVSWSATQNDTLGHEIDSSKIVAAG